MIVEGDNRSPRAHSGDWVDGVKNNTAEILADRYLGNPTIAKILRERPSPHQRSKKVLNRLTRDWAYLPITEKKILVDRLVRIQGDHALVTGGAVAESARGLLDLIPLKAEIRTAAAAAYVAIVEAVPDDVSLEQLKAFEATGKIISGKYPQLTNTFSDTDRAFASAVYATVRRQEVLQGTPLPEYTYDDSEPVSLEEAQELLGAYGMAVEEENKRLAQWGGARIFGSNPWPHVTARKAVLRKLSPGRTTRELAEIVRRFEPFEDAAVRRMVHDLIKAGEIDPPSGQVWDRRRIVARLAEAGLGTYAIAEATGFRPRDVREDRYQIAKREERLPKEFVSTPSVRKVNEDSTETTHYVPKTFPTVAQLILEVSHEEDSGAWTAGRHRSEGGPALSTHTPKVHMVGYDGKDYNVYTPNSDAVRESGIAAWGGDSNSSVEEGKNDAGRNNSRE